MAAIRSWAPRITSALGQCSRMRTIDRRPEKISRPGEWKTDQRSAFGRALAYRPGRQRSWKHRTISWARRTIAIQLAFASKLVKGKRHSPDAVSSDSTHVWVANGSGNSVTELDGSTGALVKVISGSSYGFNCPDAVSSDSTHVWVANGSGNSVTELNGSTGALVKVISGSSYGFNYPVAVSSDGAHVWVANYHGQSVTELSASTGALVKVISGSSYGFNYPVAVSSDGTHVWVANSSGNSVTELAPRRAPSSR